MTINTQDITGKDLGIFVDEHEAIIAELFLINHGENLVFNTSVSQWAVFVEGVWLQAEKANKVIYELIFP